MRYRTSATNGDVTTRFYLSTDATITTAGGLKRGGAPLEIVFSAEDETPVFTVTGGIFKDAPHPNAAKLFAQFMLTPVAQKMIADNAIHSSRVDVAAPQGQPSLKEVKFIPIALDHIEKNARDLKARFNEVFQ